MKIQKIGTITLWTAVFTLVIAILVFNGFRTEDVAQDEPNVISISHLGTAVDIIDEDIIGDTERVVYTIEIMVHAHDETIYIPNTVHQTLDALEEQSGFVVFMETSSKTLLPGEGSFTGLLQSDAALIEDRFVVTPHRMRIFTIRGELSDFSAYIGMRLVALRFYLQESGRWVTIRFDNTPEYRTGMVRVQGRRLGRSA